MKVRLNNTQGLSLIVVLIISTILLVLTGATLLFSGLGIKTASNHKTGTAALQAADAAIHHAVAAISMDYNFTALLSGSDPAFPCASLCNGTTNLATLTGSLGAYTYTVVAKNDPAESASPTTDTNKIIVLTATATGPGDSKRVIEAYVGRANVGWKPPGAVYLEPTVSTTFTGSSFKISGNDTNPGGAEGSGSSRPIPGIAVTTAADNTSVLTSLGSSSSLVAGSGGSPSVGTISSSINVDQIATNLLTLYPSDVQTLTPGYYSSGQWGTESIPKITYLPEPANGTTTLTGTFNGYGVLILDRTTSLNDLHVGGTSQWKGLIILRGGGAHIHTDPGHYGDTGGIQIWGGTMYSGNGSFDIGGTAQIYYSSQVLNTLMSRWSAAFPQPAKILGWRELLN